MSDRDRRRGRGLTMPPGRKIPRPPSSPPERPPPPESRDVAPEVAKAAGELTALAARIRACKACTRASDERAYGTGYAQAPVLLVKDRPSSEDLESGNAFASEAEPLTKAFEALEIPLGWIYGSTAVRCGAREAKLDEMKACAPHLLTEIEAVRPRVLVAFGERAVEAVRALDGRCGLKVPDDIPRGNPTPIRADLVLIATEQLPEGVTAKEAKRRLWRDLKAIPQLLA